MTEGESRAIVALLVAGFPLDYVGRASVDLYAQALAVLPDFGVAQKAARRLAVSSKRLPAIADVREAYAAIEKSSRISLAETKGLPEGPPAPPIQAFLELGRQLTGRKEESILVALVRELPEEEPGRCDDCHELEEKIPRKRYGQFVVCGACALSRMRARKLLKASS